MVLVRDNLNPGFRVKGVLMTMFSTQTFANRSSTMCAATWGEDQTVVPRNVTDGASFGKPVIYYDIKCAGAGLPRAGADYRRG